jgi:hypothetical protein
LPVGDIEIVAQGTAGEVKRPSPQPRSEHPSRDKQLFSLVLLRSGDVADRRLIELTDEAGRSIFADVNLRADLVGAEGHLDLIARAQVRSKESGHENRCALAQDTFRSARIRRPDGSDGTVMDGFDARRLGAPWHLSRAYHEAGRCQILPQSPREPFTAILNPQRSGGTGHETDFLG